MLKTSTPVIHDMMFFFKTEEAFFGGGVERGALSIIDHSMLEPRPLSFWSQMYPLSFDLILESEFLKSLGCSLFLVLNVLDVKFIS